jgi:hypothetical protein
VESGLNCLFIFEEKNSCIRLTSGNKNRIICVSYVINTEVKVKDDSTLKNNTKTIEENSQKQIKDALLLKRKAFIEEIKNIDLAISQLKKEFSERIEEFEHKKKFPEEGLQHIDALLRLEGIIINNEGNNSLSPKKSTLNNSASITDAVFNLFEKVHKPMHYMELTHKLREEGIYIPGKNPSATLLSRINRDKRFKRIPKRGTYALCTWRVRSGKVRRRKKAKKRINEN